MASTASFLLLYEERFVQEAPVTDEKAVQLATQTIVRGSEGCDRDASFRLGTQTLREGSGPRDVDHGTRSFFVIPRGGEYSKETSERATA